MGSTGIANAVPKSATASEIASDLEILQIELDEQRWQKKQIKQLQK